MPRMHARVVTLGEAARKFLQPTTFLIIGLIAVIATLRSVLFPWYWQHDLIILPTFYILLSPVELMIHVRLLHGSGAVAAAHIKHHLEPSTISRVFIPRCAWLAIFMAFCLPLAVATYFRIAVLFAAGFWAAIILFLYELTHFLCHISYLPKNEYFGIWMRRLRDRHTIHHCRAGDDPRIPGWRYPTACWEVLGLGWADRLWHRFVR